MCNLIKHKEREGTMGAVPAKEGMKVTINGEEYTVGPKCECKDGRWCCVTCGEIFPNQFMKDTHIGDNKTHELAWLCLDHGLVVP